MNATQEKSGEIHQDKSSDEKHSLSHQEERVVGLGDAELLEAGQDGVAVAQDGHGHALLAIDHKAERRLLLKQDIRLLPLVFMLYLWAFIDRTNIGNARLAGLEADLGMAGYDYNVALTMFYVGYIVFEMPSTAICKIVGPGKWVPILVFFFGVTSMCTAFCHSYGSLLVVRLIVGAFEAGMQPCLAFYLSRWYTRSELVFRIAFYIVAGPCAGMFGGALAYGLLSIDHIGWLTRWRNVFFVEGIITTGIGFLGYLLMPDRPATARWLNEEEKALAATRIKRESPAITHVTEEMRKELWWSGINANSITLAVIFFINAISVQGISVFLPTLIRAIYPGLSTLDQTARSIPPYAVGTVLVLTLPFISWKINRRAIMMALTAPLAIIGYGIFLGTTDPNARFGACFLITAVYCFGAYTLAYAAANVSPDTARGAAIAITSFGGNLGGLVSTWTYTSNYAPNYVPGNSVGITCCILLTLMPLGLWAYQVRENRIRERGGRDYRLEGKTPEQIALLGHRHPEFRYTY